MELNNVTVEDVPLENTLGPTYTQQEYTHSDTESYTEPDGDKIKERKRHQHLIMKSLQLADHGYEDSDQPHLE